jgi:hypothetical protein
MINQSMAHVKLESVSPKVTTCKDCLSPDFCALLARLLLASAMAAESGVAPARGQPLGPLLSAPPPGLAPRLPRIQARRRGRAPRAVVRVLVTHGWG